MQRGESAGLILELEGILEPSGSWHRLLCCASDVSSHAVKLYEMQDRCEMKAS